MSCEPQFVYLNQEPEFFEYEEYGIPQPRAANEENNRISIRKEISELYEV
jgi:hypothetical protein